MSLLLADMNKGVILGRANYIPNKKADKYRLLSYLLLTFTMTLVAAAFYIALRLREMNVW